MLSISFARLETSRMRKLRHREQITCRQQNEIEWIASDSVLPPARGRMDSPNLPRPRYSEVHKKFTGGMGKRQYPSSNSTSLSSGNRNPNLIVSSLPGATSNGCIVSSQDSEIIFVEIFSPRSECPYISLCNVKFSPLACKPMTE
jgi:hypothetical protein